MLCVPGSSEFTMIIVETAVFVYHALKFLHRRSAVSDDTNKLRLSLHAFFVQERMGIFGIIRQATDRVSHGSYLSRYFFGTLLLHLCMLRKHL